MRILIADDNEMVRRGVRELLSSETGWEVCGEATPEATRSTKADDFGLTSSYATRQILKDAPEAEVLVLTCIIRRNSHAMGRRPGHTGTC